MPTKDDSARLVQFIEQHRADIGALAGRLVAAPSPNPPGDERDVAAVLEDAITTLALGHLTTHAQDHARPNLLCRMEGTAPGPTLMLSGHMDTKPPGDLSAWRSDPFTPTIADGRLYGLGACDMKGALAAMVYAAAALRHAGIQHPGTLVLAFTADEEAGSTWGALYLAQAHLLHADACLIGEPSGITRDWEYIHLVSRGALLCKVHVYGTQMHSSLSDVCSAINASEMMARTLIATRERLHLRYPVHPLCPGGPTINPGVMVKGGVTYGIVPGHAEFSMDIRCLPGMTREGVLEDLHAFLVEEQRRDARLRAEVEVETALHGWIPPTEINAEHPLVTAVQEAAARVLQTVPPLSAFPGGTDAAFFQGHAGIPTLPSFGPGLLSLAHSPNEYVPVESIVQAAKLYALAAYQYLTSPRAAFHDAR